MTGPLSQEAVAQGAGQGRQWSLSVVLKWPSAGHALGWGGAPLTQALMETTPSIALSHSWIPSWLRKARQRPF